MRKRLEELLLASDIAESLATRLAEYGEMVLMANQHVNLTGAKTPETLIPHLLDSLTLLPFISENAEASGSAEPISYIDVGSGGGFPAIPVALATGAPVTLIEATAKKARFLREALRGLGLVGEVLDERAETLGRDPQYRDRFNRGSIRAVGSAPASAELVLPFISPGGLALLQRGTVDSNEQAALADAALILEARLEDIVPVGEERCIAVVRKLNPTPLRFPRRMGVAQKRPLCEVRSTGNIQ